MDMTLAEYKPNEIGAISWRTDQDALQMAKDLDQILKALFGIKAPPIGICREPTLIYARLHTKLKPKALENALRDFKEYCEACNEHSINETETSTKMLQKAESKFDPTTLKSILHAIDKVGATSSRLLSTKVNGKPIDIQVPHRASLATSHGDDERANEDNFQIMAIETFSDIMISSGANVLIKSIESTIEPGDNIVLNPTGRPKSYWWIKE